MAVVDIENDQAVASIFKVVANSGRGDIKQAFWGFGGLPDGDLAECGGTGQSCEDRSARQEVLICRVATHGVLAFFYR